MNKKIILGAFLCGALMSLTGCQKNLDRIQPNGSSLSQDQVLAGALVSPDRAESQIKGVYAQLTAREGVYSIQGDFGYPSFVARLEHAGDNLVSTTHGYNWFHLELTLQDFQHKRSTSSDWAWTASYKSIKLSNDVIVAFKAGADDPNIAPYLGEAKAMRAWNYFNLVQLFGKTYKGNESTPAVPIITEETTPEQISNNPRKTVQEVYDFILQDLNDAVKYLAGKSADAKNRISEATAYGIRARVYLVMNEWDKAASDAQKAIEIFKGRPFNMAEAGIPNLDDVQEAINTMWGIIITDQDGVTKSGIANWTSMMTSLCFGYGGYTTMVGTYKMINTRLWRQIPKTDIRREWWAYQQLPLKVSLNAKGNVDNVEKGKPDNYDAVGYTSKLLANAYPAPSKNNDEPWVAFQFRGHPYTVVKFAPHNKSLQDKINATDFPLMRVEEMYYIQGEALIMSGKVAEGKQVIESFVKANRDPEYAMKGATPEELQDEIYLQKRVEFWGEGIAWFDMLRLKKGIQRVDDSPEAIQAVSASKDVLEKATKALQEYCKNTIKKEWSYDLWKARKELPADQLKKLTELVYAMWNAEDGVAVMVDKYFGTYPENCRWNVPAGDNTFTWQIPLNEEQNNKAIEGNNNPAYTEPKDVDQKDQKTK